jgi:hypothetical protein
MDTFVRSPIGARLIRLAETLKRQHDERVAAGITS